MRNNGGVPYGADEPTSFVCNRRPGSPRKPTVWSAPDPAPRAPSCDRDRSRPRSLAPGRLIAGRYRLLGKLGHGGMGTVWRAKDETVDREVAVKGAPASRTTFPSVNAPRFERMRREARAAARLDHPAVVNVHDVAVVDGQPWIVMELVRGRSLGAALQGGHARGA